MGYRYVFFLIFIMVVPCLHAALPSANYVSDFYYRTCANENLIIPGAGNPNLTGRRYVLGLIDTLNNGQTTYAHDADGDNIVSVGYLKGTVPKLKDSPVCCLGGYYDTPAGGCYSCGEWLVDSTDMCFDAGEYYNNGKCSPCGDGYICAAGTSSRVDCGPGYYCTDNTRHPCADGVYRCPYQNHTAPQKTRGCDSTISFATTAADECTGAGVYYSGTACVACPAGYMCPGGTSHRVVCGSGYWCANNVRTPCADGVYRCPSPTTSVGTGKRACDETWVFSE